MDTSKEYLYGFVWILVRNICMDLFGTLVWNTYGIFGLEFLIGIPSLSMLG